MKVLYSWLRDFVDVPDGPAEVGRRLSLRGLALEGLEPVAAGDSPPGAAPIADDAVLDFDVTANRPDCLSILGIAREVATAYGLPLRVPSPAATGYLRSATLTTTGAPSFTVRIEAPDLCRRYVGAAASVRIAPSPAWLQRRLAAQGVRPISNVVDVTNYVLLELGQPMHAFDHARLADAAIVVRRATAGERLTTLDGKTRTLTPEMLVIADAARATGIGGVMGGADSEVGDATTRIVFESAWFKPQSVRATARQLGLRTEASMRFERGADPTAQTAATARACALLEIIGAGRADGTVVDVQTEHHAPRVIALGRPHVEGLLGMPVPADAVVRILTALGFAPAAAGPDRWQVTVPGWRPDVARPEDLIEEVGRHHGFEHLPATFPPVHQAPASSDPRIGRDQRVRRTMLATGFSEAINFAFIDQAAAAPFAAGMPLVRLANPLSETFAVMRPSLLPGLVAAVGHNRRHEQRDVRLFEIATAFAAAGERRSLGAAWTGAAAGDHWSGHRRDVDFFDLSGVVAAVCADAGVASTLEPVETAWLVPGRAARIVAGGDSLGTVGLLAPAVADAHGVPRGDAVYVAEIDLDRLTAAAPRATTRVEPLPRFPSVVRDVALLVPDTLSAATVRDTMRAAAPPTLVGVREFDRYQGQGTPSGTVSVALRFTFRAADRTLTDDEVTAALQRMIAAATATLGAQQR
ncbi:MAG: phenylalanine--tRNA ligase subunit beta [Vicinamibacterales bacterium]